MIPEQNFRVHSFCCYIYAVTALNGMITYISLLIILLPAHKWLFEKLLQNCFYHLCYFGILDDVSHPNIDGTSMNIEKVKSTSFDHIVRSSFMTLQGNTLPLQSPKPTLYPSPCKFIRKMFSVNAKP